MLNLYKAFLDLIPDPALQVGTVQSVANNIVTLEMPGGALLKARGDGTVGQRVFVRGGVIEGAAPNLPLAVIDL